MKETTVRPASTERPESGRSGFSRWAPLVFFAFVLAGPVMSPVAAAGDWALAAAVVVVALPTFVISQVRGWDVGGASVLMVIALATAPFDSTAIMALPIYAAALLARSATEALLVEGDNRAGLGYATAQAIADAGISLDFLVAQVVGKKYSAVFGFGSDADVEKCAGIIRKAGAAKKR